MRSLIICLTLFTILSNLGCLGIEKGKPFEHVAPGNWRGVFIVEGEKIPITFNINSSEEGQPQNFVFFNGEHQLQSDSLRFWGDTVYVYFDDAQSHLRLIYEVNLMEGHWFDKTEKSYPISFQAQNAQTHRFPNIRMTPVDNITGTWAVKAIVSQDSTLETQLRIATEKNKATGSLVIDNNTSIPLEGTIQGDKIYLSGFDGRHICLFNATIADLTALHEGVLIINNESMFCTAQVIAGVGQ
ncbi:MAG: hypothetical protein GY810_03750 [Aureispira sp.]|nr:hypothetical protein [Aureispira sp.]